MRLGTRTIYAYNVGDNKWMTMCSNTTITHKANVQAMVVSLR